MCCKTHDFCFAIALKRAKLTDKVASFLMTSRLLLFFTTLGSSLAVSPLVVADEAAKPRIGEIQEANAEKNAEPASIDKVKISRTTIFDETEIKKLYKESKAQNEKMNEGLPAHLNSEEMELVTLKTLNVGGDDIKLQRELMEVLDPKPRRRLERIADLDPDAAHEMMVTMRNDQEFMSGQYDRPVSAGDPGRSANFNAGQIAGAFDKLISSLKSSRAKREKQQKELDALQNQK